MKLGVKFMVGIVALLFSTGIYAQLYVAVQSGVANIKSDVSKSLAGYEIGGAIKVGYIYDLTDHIGIGTGLEFSQYKQEVKLRTGATFSNFEVDQAGSAFVYNITTANYTEKQTLQALQIPIFLQYKKNINKGIDFNFRAGAKYFLPIDYKIKATANNVAGSGYYPDVNLTITDLPEYGFGNQNNYAETGKYQTKGIIMSSFELGFTFDMGMKSALYTAFFLENGYGSIIKQDHNESYIGYNAAAITDRKVNGLYSTDKNAKIRPVAFGLTLGWNFK